MNDSPSPLCLLVGSRVRRLRVALDMSQRELARRAGCHRETVYHVENGRHAPSIPNLIAIARALGVSVSSLLEEQEKAA